MRDGKEEEIEATDLVPGDLVKVVAGNCIPADLRIVNVMSVAL
jgi:Ca2+-transporting ATPase